MRLIILSATFTLISLITPSTFACGGNCNCDTCYNTCCSTCTDPFGNSYSCNCGNCNPYSCNCGQMTCYQMNGGTVFTLPQAVSMPNPNGCPGTYTNVVTQLPASVGISNLTQIPSSFQYMECRCNK